MFLMYHFWFPYKKCIGKKLWWFLWSIQVMTGAIGSVSKYWACHRLSRGWGRVTSCCVASCHWDSSSSRIPWDSPDVSQSPPRWEIPARSPAEKLSNLLGTLHTVLLPGLTRVFRPILYNFFTKYNKTSTFFWEGFWKKVFHNFRPNSNFKKFTVQTDTEKKIIIGQCFLFLPLIAKTGCRMAKHFSATE